VIPRCRRGLVAAALVALLAGCAGPDSAGPPAAAPAGSAPAPAPAAPPTPAPPTPAPPTPEPGAGRDGAGCVGFARTVSTVRGIADALRQGPVLPAGVALFLLGPRAQAAAPGVSDPQLAAARIELVAAIDDLDAQGRALLPPGGNATRDAVQLDPTRILAAAAELERLCARR
jgi:hypothetical protein